MNTRSILEYICHVQRHCQGALTLKTTTHRYCYCAYFYFPIALGSQHKPIRYAPHPAITCSFCVVLLGTYVLRGNLSLLGMVQHVVDYSYSQPDYRRRFTAVSTARAMPARLAEGSFPGRVLFGTLVFHLPSFFYDIRRNRFDVRKYGVERDGGKKPR